MQAQVAVADFDAGDAAEAVRGDGHAFDQVFLDGAVGFRSAWQRSARSRRSAGSSPGRMGDLLVSPWTVLLRLERVLPSAVRGPVDFCVICRYSERRNDTGRHFRARA